MRSTRPFAGHSIDGTFDNDSWIAATRRLRFGRRNQLHFGANFQHRNSRAMTTALRKCVGQRLHDRLLGIALGLHADDRLPLRRQRATSRRRATYLRALRRSSAALSSKSLHVAAEGQYLQHPTAYVRRAIAWATCSRARTRAINSFPATAWRPVCVPDGDPSFWGGYFEAGYFLTGETRGYKNGTWDRTKVLKPFSKGGWGACRSTAASTISTSTRAS